MQQLRGRGAKSAATSVPSMVRFQLVVHELLRTPRQVRAPAAHGAGGHAVRHHQAPVRPSAAGCFAGAEGVGCSLSFEEQRIGRRVWADPMSWEVA